MNQGGKLSNKELYLVIFKSIKEQSAQSFSWILVTAGYFLVIV
jgi:hypothetical protein